MKIKILAITALIILPLLSTGCSDSSSEAASVKMDFSGAAITESFSSIPGIQEADSGTSNLPVDIYTLKIIVTRGSEVVYNYTFSRDVIVNASDTVTLDIPAGTGLVFTVNGYNIGATLCYTGASDPVDIIAGAEISVPIILAPVVLTMDAEFSLNLKEPDGITDFDTDKTYYSQTIADVLTVNVATENNETTVTLQSIDPINYPKTYSYTTTSLTGLVAYPYTFQFVLVKIEAPDGTIAAIGTAIKNNLASGNNGSFDIRMFPPDDLILQILV